MPPKKPTDKATRLNAQKRPVHEERDETNSDVSYTQEETDLEESDSDEEGSEKNGSGDVEETTAQPTAPITHFDTAPMKTPKVSWTVEIDRKLLLQMAMVPDKCKGKEGLRRIARMWRERPTVKAIEVRLSKLRDEARAAAANLDDAPSDEEEIPPPNTRTPTIDPDEVVFIGTHIRWRDLSEGLRNEVRDNVIRAQQEQAWRAAEPTMENMHRQNYVAQLRLEDQARRVAEAARGLVQLAEEARLHASTAAECATRAAAATETTTTSPSAQQPAPESAQTAQERATRAMIEGLTGTQSGEGDGAFEADTNDEKNPEES